MKNKLHIRLVQQTDAEEISQLICENARKILVHYYTPIQLDTFLQYYSTEVVIEKIRTQSFFCGEQEGKIIGTIALDNDFVVGLYTHVGYLNQGVGSQLIKHIESFAAISGLTEIKLAASPDALDFYAKKGWDKVTDIDMTYNGIIFKETLMKKSIQHDTI